MAARRPPSALKARSQPVLSRPPTKASGNRRAERNSNSSLAAPNPQQTSMATIARTPRPDRSSSITWPSAWKTATVTTAEMKAWATWSNLRTPGTSHVS